MKLKAKPSDPRMVSLYEKLNEVVNSSGFNQEEIAARIGIDVKTLRGYLGGNKVGYEFLLRFCDAMEVQLAWLLSIDNTPKSVVEIKHPETSFVVQHIDGLDPIGRKMFLIYTKGICSEWRNYLIETNGRPVFVTKPGLGDKLR